MPRRLGGGGGGARLLAGGALLLSAVGRGRGAVHEYRGDRFFPVGDAEARTRPAPPAPPAPAPPLSPHPPRAAGPPLAGSHTGSPTRGSPTLFSTPACPEPPGGARTWMRARAAAGARA